MQLPKIIAKLSWGSGSCCKLSSGSRVEPGGGLGAKSPEAQTVLRFWWT